MEFFDAVSLFLAGAALGIPAGHWIARQERTLDYERGRLDGLGLVWPYLLHAIAREHMARSGQPARDPADGGDARG